MIIEIVTPAPRGSRKGNRVTALRWAMLLRRLGHEVRVDTTHRHPDADLFVVLNAYRCADPIRTIAAARGSRPLLVALTGTDLYVHGRDPATLASLRSADRILTLQERAADLLDADLKERVRVVPQSATAPELPTTKNEQRFEICVVAHLREIKDPLCAARAARLLPRSSRIHVLHVGGEIDPALPDAARREMDDNPRYQWLGPLARARTLELIARCRALVLSSRQEGGANVVSEAIACSVPVLSSRVDGSVGMLGEEYPGLFAAGDSEELARLLHRFETDPAWRDSLEAHCARLRRQYTPEHETGIWRSLLTELSC